MAQTFRFSAAGGLALATLAALAPAQAMAQDNEGPPPLIAPGPDSGVQVLEPGGDDGEAEPSEPETTGTAESTTTGSETTLPTETILLPDPAAESLRKLEAGPDSGVVPVGPAEPGSVPAAGSEDGAGAHSLPPGAEPGAGQPAENGVQTMPREALEKPLEDRPLRLGVLARGDIARTMAGLEEMTERLSQALGRDVEILPMASYGAMIDAQQSQRIDGGFYSSEAYALAEADCRCLEPIVAPAAEDGTTAYYAVIVVRRGSGITRPDQLEGRVVAAGPGASVGAYRMQIGALRAEGVDLVRSASTLRETESGAEAVGLVVAAEADAAFAWSSLEGDQDSGYSRGTLTDLVARGEIENGDVAVIWRSPAIAHGPLAVLKTLPEDSKNDIRSHMLQLQASDPVAYDLLNPYYGGGYAEVEAEDYRGMGVLAASETDRPASNDAQ